mgnify:CR=1 FL=1
MLEPRKRNVRWVDIDMAEIILDKLVIQFSHSNKAEGKSPRTISWYSEMLADFIKFLKLTGSADILSNFNIERAREFVVYEQERGLSPFTVQGKVRALKAFSSWLHREGYISDNLLSRLKLPKVPNNLIEPLTNAEIESLVIYYNLLTEIGCRDIAILIVFLDTGIRLSELSGLLFVDTHIDEGYLKVLGKGNKERIVPIGASTQKMLWRYTIHFRPEPVPKADSNLFLTLDGDPLKPNAIELLLKRWGKKAGVPRLHAHLCRHTFATNFLTNNCGDVFRLQQILGHTSLAMTNRYVHFASTQALMNGKTLSPVDQMRVKSLRSYKIDQNLRKLDSKRKRD